MSARYDPSVARKKSAVDSSRHAGPTGVVARITLRARLPQPHLAYAATVEVRTEFGRPVLNMRLRTATATPASVHWPGPSRARSRSPMMARSEENTSELQSRQYLVCRL